MTPEQIHQAVSILAGARREVKRVNGLPPDLRPRTLEEGYEIQRGFIAHWGEAIAGWKIGATSVPAQQLFDVSGPIYGPVFSSQVAISPVELDGDMFQHFCLECEYAFRLGSALPARAGGYARGEVEAAIDAVIPAFEMVSPRYEEIPKGDGPSAVADCALTAGLTLGEPWGDWQSQDLADTPVRFRVDGEVVAEGSGADVLGHPVAAMEWAVNTLTAAGFDLEAGHIISTGTCTGVNFVARGQTCRGEFGPLGEIEVRFG